MMISKVCEDSCLSHKVMSWNYLTDMMPLIIFEMWQMPTESLNKPQINRIFLTLSWRSPYHIETSPLICSANQWTGFYMIWTSIMKELSKKILHVIYVEYRAHLVSLTYYSPCKGVFRTLSNIQDEAFCWKNRNYFG